MLLEIFSLLSAFVATCEEALGDAMARAFDCPIELLFFTCGTAYCSTNNKSLLDLLCQIIHEKHAMPADDPH